MKLIWSPTALADLEAIRAYIAEEHLVASQKVARSIRTSIERLLDFPVAGRVGRVSGTREWVIAGTAYIAVYTVMEDELRIVSILHGRRSWPKTF
jgi:toxin ParE1/3/4